MTGQPDVVAALLAEPRAALLAVDFDGTLAAIVERPEDARAVDGTRDVLAALTARLGAVAIVSGRAAEDVVRLAGVADVAGLRVLGHYGLQRWDDGAVSSPDPVPGIAVARSRLPGVLEGADAGVRVEDKQHSLAVHTRGASHPDEELAALEPALETLADACGLEAVPGRYVIELRPRGTDKGSALRSLVGEVGGVGEVRGVGGVGAVGAQVGGVGDVGAVGAQVGGVGAQVVIYIGDDLGDLPAFEVVEALRGEGMLGLTVASVDPHDADVPAQVAQRADMVLDGPTAVVAWLAGLAAMLT